MHKKIWFQFIAVFMLMSALFIVLAEASPALAAYIGPNRTVTTSEWVEEGDGYGAECNGTRWVVKTRCDGCSQNCVNKLQRDFPDNNTPGDVCNAAYAGTRVYGYSCDLVKQKVTKTYTEATISSTTSCAAGGSGGWCLGDIVVALTGTEGADACTDGYRLSGFETNLGHTVAVSGCNASRNMTVSTEGTTAFEAWAHSTLGDTSRKTSKTLKIDKTAPVLNYAQPDLFTFVMSGSDALSGIDHFEIRINGGTWTPGTTHTLLGGVNNIDYRAYDIAGNVTTKSTVIITDNVPPETLSASISPGSPNGNNNWYVTNPIITVSAADSVTGISFAGIILNGADHDAQSGYTVTANGSNTVLMKAVDGAGNIRSEAPDTFSSPVKIDTEKPNIRATLPVSFPGGWYDGAVSLDASASTDASSGIATIAFQLDGGGYTAASSFQVVDEGKHTVDILVTDQAGNTNTQSHTTNIDLQAPTIRPTLSGTIGSNGWYLGPVTVALNANDNFLSDSVVAYDLDGAGLIAGGSFTVSADGVHAFEGQITDPVHNVAAASGNFKIDSTDPVLDVHVSPVPVAGNWYAADTLVDAGGSSDTGSGIDRIEIQVDGAGYNSVSSVTLSEGQHTVDIRVTDMAGNTRSDSFAYNVDLNPPTLDPSVSGTAGAAAPWYSSAVKVAANADDTAGGPLDVSYSLDAGRSIAEDSLMVSAEGLHSVEFTAVDPVGNTSTDRTTFGIDTSTPSVAITSHSANQVVKNTITFAGEASDKVSGIYQVEVKVGSGGWHVFPPDVLDIDPVTGSWSFELDTKPLGGGAVNFTVRAQDRAGNYSPEASVSLIVKNRPPALDIPDHWLVYITVTPKHTKGDGGPVVGAVATVYSATYGKDTWKLKEKDDWAVRWDGRFTVDGLEYWAPPGEYKVVVRAWDEYGNESSDSGIIHVPEPVDIEIKPDFEILEISGTVSEMGSDSIKIDGEKYDLTDNSKLTGDIGKGVFVVGTVLKDKTLSVGTEEILTLRPLYFPIHGVVEEITASTVTIDGESLEITPESDIPVDLAAGVLVTGTGADDQKGDPNIVVLEVITFDPLPFKGEISAITEGSLAVNGAEYVITEDTQIHSASGLEAGDYVTGWYQDPGQIAQSVTEVEPEIVQFEGTVDAIDDKALSVDRTPYEIVPESVLPDEAAQGDMVSGSAYLYPDGGYKLIEAVVAGGSVHGVVTEITDHNEKGEYTVYINHIPYLVNGHSDVNGALVVGREVSGELGRDGFMTILRAKSTFPLWILWALLGLLFLLLLWLLFLGRYEGSVVGLDEANRTFILRVNAHSESARVKTISYHERLDATVRLFQQKDVKGRLLFFKAYTMALDTREDE